MIQILALSGAFDCETAPGLFGKFVDPRFMIRNLTTRREDTRFYDSNFGTFRRLGL